MAEKSMAGKEVIMNVPDRCDECPVVQALFGDIDNPPGFNSIQNKALTETFENCPGFRKGVRGILRMLHQQWQESLTYGGDYIDLDRGGQKFASKTFNQGLISGCGTPLRNFVEIERMRKGGFE